MMMELSFYGNAVFISAVMWYVSIELWRGGEAPIEQFDPESVLDDIKTRWSPDPPPLRSWIGGTDAENPDTEDVVIGEVIGREEHGINDDDDYGPLTTFDMQIPGDGKDDYTNRKITEHGFDYPITSIGMFIPMYKNEQYGLARDHRPLTIKNQIIDHRQHVGLIDAGTAAILKTGTQQDTRLDSIVETGKIWKRHRQVQLHYHHDGERKELTGFLRYEELAAMRRSGQAPITIDANGNAALGPIWY